MILQGDALDRLRDLSAGSVQTCVTSPPFYGLRDYGADGQLGLEATPDEYVARLVDVFREVRRVLRDDGTVWLNLGDSYFGTGRGPSDLAEDRGFHTAVTRDGFPLKGNYRHDTLKSKDLIGIPWRVAFALQADGWWLRSDIVWAKPNPMPESVTDRPTRSHEFIFLLTKQARYWYDADAIREDNSPLTVAVHGYEQRAERHKHADEFDHHGSLGVNGATRELNGRNKRSVWTVATQPFPGAHFAVFPAKLIEPCILAGSAVGDTVLDPFAGAGTTGCVALAYGRDFIGIELNPDYARMAEQRIEQAARGKFNVREVAAPQAETLFDALRTNRDPDDGADRPGPSPCSC